MPPRLELLERHFFVVVELVGRERDRSVADDYVIGKDHLVQPLERIDADRAREPALEPELFADLAQHGGLGVLAALEEARDEPVPLRGPADAAHEHDAARALDDGRDDRYGIAPLHEARTAGTRAVSRPPRTVAASSARQRGQ